MTGSSTGSANGRGPAADRPVFLVGCPRSGTTLLQLMLHAHPRIAVPPENRYVLPAYYRRAEWGDLTVPANRGRLARFVTGKGSSFRDFDLDGPLVRQRIVDGPPTLGSALEIVMQEFAATAGAARWCDKRPMYVRHVRALRRMFPDAQFIHLIRDGRSCAASLLRMPWFHGDFARAIGTWMLAVDHADVARRRLGPAGWFDLRYEDLLGDPEAELRRLCTFLGEDFAPAMLEPGDVASILIPDRKIWHANTAGPLLTERAESWRRELPAGDVRFAADVAGRRLRRHGYPAGAEHGGRAPVRVLRFALDHQRRRSWIARQEAHDARAARRESTPIASAFSVARARGATAMAPPGTPQVPDGGTGARRRPAGRNQARG